MKPIKASRVGALPLGAEVPTCDNSGAKTVKIFSVKCYKGRKGRKPAASVGDLVMCAVKTGKPDMRKTVVFGIVVRQRKEFRRPNGMRVQFEDNAVVVLKDDKGNPKGTIFKGPIAKEVAVRWPAVAKIARIVV